MDSLTQSFTILSNSVRFVLHIFYTGHVLN